MTDPWIQGEDLEKLQAEVADHPLTKEAEHINGQEDELKKLAEERQKQADEEVSPDVEVDPAVQSKPAQETGYSAAAASDGGQGGLGEGIGEEPAGNADSDLPTEAEKQDEEAKEAPKAKRTNTAKK
ncbi:MAG: hypothetical protein JWR61_5876 [Ferruginibacter sp.]|uniref:hypothetical protein n=1 Tax=Ferruginibacter sp. TaxID=1940288 RepID=UPI00265AAA70|nr:hypothetical protein [Ferruginibacter sp.]MDB5280921.1 hypothetical protein [Ferruginibacter sp.]